MRWRITIRSAVALAVFGCVATATPLLAQTELNGVWSVVETSGHTAAGDWESGPVQPSLFIFMDGYYSVMYVSRGEARPLMADDATRESITEEQVRSVFMPSVANSGTYEVSGSTVTTRPTVALWPNFMEGGSREYQYAMQNGMLVLTSEGEDWRWTARLRRLR